MYQHSILFTHPNLAIKFNNKIIGTVIIIPHRDSAGVYASLYLFEYNRFETEFSFFR